MIGLIFRFTIPDKAVISVTLQYRPVLIGPWIPVCSSQIRWDMMKNWKANTEPVSSLNLYEFSSTPNLCGTSEPAVWAALGSLGHQTPSPKRVGRAPVSRHSEWLKLSAYTRADIAGRWRPYCMAKWIQMWQMFFDISLCIAKQHTQLCSGMLTCFLFYILTLWHCFIDRYGSLAFSNKCMSCWIITSRRVVFFLLSISYFLPRTTKYCWKQERDLKAETVWIIWRAILEWRCLILLRP